MKITYDPQADAMYILLQAEGTQVAETREVTEEVLVDLDANENIIGLEVLSISQQIPLSNLFSVNLENLMTQVA